MQAAAQTLLLRPTFADYSPLLVTFEKMALMASVDLAVTFDNKHRQRFEALTPSRQQALIYRIGLMNEILENSVRLLGSHKGHFYLRTVLKKFGWKLDPGVMDLIGENDTVEIYGTDFTLKVANIRFLQLCSYTLEDVLSYEFFELFERDSKIAEHLIGHWPKMAAGKLAFTTDLGPDHVVREVFSARRKQFWVESKALATVYGSDGAIVGPLYSAAVRLLDSNSNQVLDI